MHATHTLTLLLACTTIICLMHAPNRLRTESRVADMNLANLNHITVKNHAIDRRLLDQHRSVDNHDLQTAHSRDADTHLHPNAQIGAVTNKPQRIFPQAQADPLVPCVWAGTNIPSATVPKISHGKDLLPSLNVSTTDWSLAPNRHQYVSTGSYPGDVSVPVTMHVIYALDAVKLCMELKHALKARKLKALIPYHPDAWEEYLRAANILHKHKHTITELRLGFHLSFPNITSTPTPPNRDSIVQYTTHFLKVVNNELQTGRYIGPASKATIEALIGPFQSSPMSITPKPGRIDKYRILQNYLFPLTPSITYPNPSINLFVNPSDFPTTWGTFTVTALMLARLPPNSKLATRDVSKAYRRGPIHYTQWPAAVMRTGEDAFCVDTAIGFGSKPSGGCYSNIRDTSLTIIRSKGIGPINPWVDDHLFARILLKHLNNHNKSRQQWHVDIIARGGKHQTGGRVWYGGKVFEDGTLNDFVKDCKYPICDLLHSSPRSDHDQLYVYNFNNIDKLSARLGIPWEKTKDMPFASLTVYIGFLWDLRTSRVLLTPEKKTKYLDAIRNWQVSWTHTLKEVEKLYRKLLHTCAIIPRGCTFLTKLEAMLGLFASNPFRPISAPTNLADDLKW